MKMYCGFVEVLTVVGWGWGEESLQVLQTKHPSSLVTITIPNGAWSAVHLVVSPRMLCVQPSKSKRNIP